MNDVRDYSGAPYIRQEPGPNRSMPRDKECFQSFSGIVIDRFVPPKELQAIYSLNEKTFGRRTPVDWAAGQQMGAELKVLLDFWDIDSFGEGRIIVCPVGNRDRELLHRLIEYAYTTYSVVNEVRTVWKRIFE